MKNSVPSIL